MNDLMTAFKEHKIFKQNRPWDVNKMIFPTKITAPPHYADPIEVLLCCDLVGDIYIGGNKFELCGKQIFYIPPRIVHSVFYQKNYGYVKVLKINIEQLNPLLNIEEILKREKKSFLSLPACLSYFDEIEHISDTFDTSTHIAEICECILTLFNRLIQASGHSCFDNEKNDVHNHNLRKVILWTEQNYKSKISLDDASKLIGYERHYFCNKFKSLTGISYINYVNNLRVQYACELLTNGCSVSVTCEQCGFNDLSYFIKLFKKITGVTPKSFVKNTTLHQTYL